MLIHNDALALAPAAGQTDRLLTGEEHLQPVFVDVQLHLVPGELMRYGVLVSAPRKQAGLGDTYLVLGVGRQWLCGEDVAFWYQDHRTERRVDEKLSAAAFIGRLVMHIPKKHSRMVHRYGLYRRNKGALSKALGNLLPKRQLTLFATDQPNRKTWQERATESFGENPLKCPDCEAEMILWEVWHPEKGFLYHIFHEDETPMGRRFKRNAKGQLGRRRNPVSRQQTGCVA